MIRIVIQINNWLWKKQQEKRKENSWKNQLKWNKNRKKNHEQSMNWKYINNQKTDIFKNNCQKKELYFHCEKKKHQVKKYRNLQQEKSTETQTQITTTKEICIKLCNRIQTNCFCTELKQWSICITVLSRTEKQS